MSVLRIRAAQPAAPTTIVPLLRQYAKVVCQRRRKQESGHNPCRRSAAAAAQEPHTKDWRAALAMQDLVFAHLMPQRPCRADIEASLGPLAEKLQPGTANPRCRAYKAIYGKSLSFFVAGDCSGRPLVDFTSARCYTSRGLQSRAAVLEFLKKKFPAASGSKSKRLFSCRGDLRHMLPGVGRRFFICAPAMAAAPSARWIWAGGLLSLDNGRDRADHGGGAKRENGHFQGVGEDEVDQPHELRRENFSLALRLFRS